MSISGWQLVKELFSFCLYKKSVFWLNVGYILWRDSSFRSDIIMVYKVSVDSTERYIIQNFVYCKCLRIYFFYYNVDNKDNPFVPKVNYNRN